LAATITRLRRHAIDLLLESTGPFYVSRAIAIRSLPARRITKVYRIVGDVSIEIDVTAVEPNWIFGAEPSDLRIVEPGAVIHQPGIGIAFATGVIITRVACRGQACDLAILK